MNVARKPISKEELKKYMDMSSAELEALPKKECDALRSRIIDDFPIQVVYTGNIGGFHKGKIIKAAPRFSTGSGFPYPFPKHRAVDFRIVDEDGDSFSIAKYATDKLYKGFERVEEETPCQH